jgi:RNA polymerase sigma-70 factor (ECF subfamily)
MEDENWAASRCFPATAWTTIQKANVAGDADADAAMDRFVRAYWKPIYHFIRAKGVPADRAEDLTQEFLLRLMERDWLDRADRERGRFRNFVLRVLVRFLSDQSPRRAPRQRQFEQRLVAISDLLREEDCHFEPATGETPEEIFDRRWAAAVVQSVLDLLRMSYEAENKPHCYHVFAATFLERDPNRRVSQESLGESLGLSRDQVRYAQQQAELRFLQLLRIEVRGQVDSKGDVETEIREILRLSGAC